MVEDRLEPALQAGHLSHEDILEFFETCEEHGRQHVFLYLSKTRPFKPPTPAQISSFLKGRGAEVLLEHPEIVEMPAGPMVVDVRSDASGFTVKVVRTRETFVTRSSIIDNSGNQVVTNVPERSRAVDVFRARADGLLELRTSMHKNRVDYADDVRLAWGAVSPLLDWSKFDELPLAVAKRQFLEDCRKPEVAEAFIFRHTLVRNQNSGTTMALGSRGPSASLADDPVARRAVEDVLDRGTGAAEALLMRYKKMDAEPDDSDFGVEFNVRLGGKSNEFAITARCSRSVYDDILSRILRANG